MPGYMEASELFASRLADPSYDFKGHIYFILDFPSTSYFVQCCDILLSPNLTQTKLLFTISSTASLIVGYTIIDMLKIYFSY